MRFWLFVCGAVLLPVAALGQPATPAGRINPGGPMIPANPDPMRLCYYGGVPYSDGALIKSPVGGVLRCSRNSLKAFNSKAPQPLEWRTLSSKSGQ